LLSECTFRVVEGIVPWTPIGLDKSLDTPLLYPLLREFWGAGDLALGSYRSRVSSWDVKLGTMTL
jgi:hypothetical protein